MRAGLRVISLEEQLGTDIPTAIAKAKRSNDVVAEIVRTYPAAVPGIRCASNQDPQAAVAEPKRTVLERCFKGALINGCT
jgi:2,3-dihydroxybenzoate decarboxylase